PVGVSIHCSFSFAEGPGGCAAPAPVRFSYLANHSSAVMDSTSCRSQKASEPLSVQTFTVTGYHCTTRPLHPVGISRTYSRGFRFIVRPFRVWVSLASTLRV